MTGDWPENNRPWRMDWTTTTTTGTIAADRRLAALVPALLVAAMALSAGAVAAYAPPERGEMAVVFAPWVGGAEAYAAILAAGGRLSGNSRFENIPIAYAEDAGFKARIQQQGALLIIAATGLCGPILAESSSGELT